MDRYLSQLVFDRNRIFTETPKLTETETSLPKPKLPKPKQHRNFYVVFIVLKIVTLPKIPHFFHIQIMEDLDGS